VTLDRLIFPIRAVIASSLRGQAGKARVTIHDYVHSFLKVRGLYEFVEYPRLAKESPPFSTCYATTDNFRLVPRGTNCQGIKNGVFA
jgi:hypothetical protein